MSFAIAARYLNIARMWHHIDLHCAELARTEGGPGDRAAVYRALWGFQAHLEPA